MVTTEMIRLFALGKNAIWKYLRLYHLKLTKLYSLKLLQFRLFSVDTHAFISEIALLHMLLLADDIPVQSKTRAFC